MKYAPIKYVHGDSILNLRKKWSFWTFYFIVSLVSVYTFCIVFDISKFKGNIKYFLIK